MHWQRFFSCHSFLFKIPCIKQHIFLSSNSQNRLFPELIYFYYQRCIRIQLYNKEHLFFRHKAYSTHYFIAGNSLYFVTILTSEAFDFICSTAFFCYNGALRSRHLRCCKLSVRLRYTNNQDELSHDM